MRNGQAHGIKVGQRPSPQWVLAPACGQWGYGFQCLGKSKLKRHGSGDFFSPFINGTCTSFIFLCKVASRYKSCMDGEARKQRIVNDWKLDRLLVLASALKMWTPSELYNMFLICGPLEGELKLLKQCPRRNEKWEKERWIHGKET